MTPSGMNDAGGDQDAPDLALLVGGPDQRRDAAATATPAPTPTGDMSALDCVPVSALAAPDADDNQQLVNPEPGDPVNYQVEGTIDHIEGELAYVKRKSVNGEDVTESAAEEANEPPDADDQAGSGGAGAGAGDSDYADLEKSANGVNL